MRNTSSDRQTDLADPREIAVVCHGGQGGAASVARLLSEVGAVRLAEYASLVEAFETAPDTLVAVLLVDPAEALARRISEGEEPMAALAGWRAENGALLAACDRVRRKVILLPDAAGPAAAALAGYLGLAPLPESEAPQEQLAEHGLSPVLRVLAGALLAADPEAREIRDDLEARLPSFSGQAAPGAEAVGAACRAYMDLAAQSQAVDEDAAGRIERLEHEEALLRETLAHAKAEFETLLTERGMPQKRGEEAERKVAQAKGDHLRVQTSETLLKADLKSQRTARDEAESLARMARKEVERLGKELEMLRLVQDELNGQIEDTLRRERADLVVKNSLLSAHQAQLASLRERSALRENILGAVLLEGDRDRAALRDELAQAAQAASETEAGLQARIATLEAELTRVYGSRSWRITEPLRSTSSSLRGKPER